MAVWQKYPKLLCLFWLGTMLTACNDRNYDVDVSQIEYEASLVRFEQELFSIPKENLSEGISYLYEKYPVFSELYFEQILRAGRYPRLNIQQISTILNDPYMLELKADVDTRFSDISEVEDDLSQLFKHVLYYYPGDSIPQLYTMLSAFTYSVVTYEQVEAVSLDMFLGEDYKYYPSRDFPRYLMKRMRPEFIAPQVAKTFFTKKFPEEENSKEVMLSKMIYFGKQLFFLDVMMPNLQDTLKIEYSAAKLDWCKDQEARIYQHFVDQKLFYETSQEKVRPYLADGPFTIADGVPDESAPRIGEWLGWQIVRGYMKSNPEVTPQELFEEQDFQKIFKKSKYKP